MRRRVSLALAMVVILMMATPSLVAAEEQPQLPAIYWGGATIYGPGGEIGAPAGTVITAEVNGGSGTFVVTQAGQYGGPAGDDPKLLVQGNIVNGSLIRFFANGYEADETSTFQEGVIKELNLTISDTTAPVITNWAPTGLIGQARPTISADYSDALAGIDTSSVVLTLDDVDVTAQSTVTTTGVSYTPAEDLAEISHTVGLSVSDVLGNQATKEWSFDIPTIPVISNWAPTGTIAQARPTISADYADAIPGIDTSSVALILDGVDVTAQSTVTTTGVSYTPTADLAEGSHNVHLSVSDLVGNPATKEWSFSVDTIAPVIANWVPTGMITQARPTISADYSDATPGTIDTASVTLILDGSNVTAQSTVTATGISYVPTAALAESPHNVELSVYDTAGNEAIQAWSFTVDTLAPDIANWAPTGTIADIRPTISADYSDAFTGIDTASVVLTLDGDDVTTWSTVTATGVSYSLAKALAEGSHTVELSVSDLAVNEAIQAWSFTISTPPPPPPEEVEELSPEEAADILEELQPEEVAEVMEEVSTEHVADILEEMSAEVAGEVMEEISTEKLTETVSEMSEESLTERLPELSAEKLYEVPPEVLFEALPNAPTEQLVGEEPPVPPPDLEAPTIFETPTGVRYLVIRTEAGEWAIIVGTPEPLTKIMVKVKRELADIETLVEVLDTKPAEIVAELPDQQLVNTYVRITVQNIPPEDIIAGHLAFQVEKDWMETNEIHKWSVVLYRYDEQLKLWIALPTKRVDEDESYVYYTAVTQKFSAFAIAGSGTVPTIGFEASDITISPDDVAIGEEVTIGADITNLSTEEGTYVIALWVNNTVEEVREVTVAAEDTETVSFTVVPEEEDTYEVRIDRLMGSFTVWEVLPSKPTPAWLYAVAVIGGLIVLSAVVSAIVWLRRRPVGVRYGADKPKGD